MLKTDMPGGELLDGSEGEEQEPMMDGEERGWICGRTRQSFETGSGTSEGSTDETSRQFGSSGCEGIEPCVETQSCIGVGHSRGAINAL